MKPNRGLGLKLLASAGACALLGACVGNPFEDAKVDPRSPIAKEVATTVKPDAPYPTFAGIPPVPKDVRPRRQYGVAAGQIDQAAAQLERATADSAWTLRNADTDAFIGAARQSVGPDVAAPQPGDTEAFAAAQRKRATPPPPAKH